MVDTLTKTGKAAFTAAIAAVVIGVGVLAGWLFELEFLKRTGPGLAAMNPATAVTLILAGVSLALFLQPPGKIQQSYALILTARLCALVVTLIGLAKLTGFLWGWDIGVDRWLFASKLPDRLRLPNRIAPNTALDFLLLGGALLFVDVRNRFVRSAVESSAAVIGFGSLLAILGYAYGLGALIQMALYTAISFSVLILAFFLSHTDTGLLAILVGDSAGGTMARRLLPAAVLVPAGLGWLTLQGVGAGIYGGEFGVVVFAVGNILVFTFLVCWNANGLFSLDLGRRKAEEALRESEARIRMLVNSSKIGLWDWNLVTNEVFFSPEWKNQLGYTDAELPNRFEEWESRLHPEDREATLASERDYVEGRRPDYEVEFRLRHKDGSWRWILTRASLTRDATGQAVRITGCHIDITARKQVAAALQESNEKFHLLADNITDAFWIRSPDALKVHYISPGFERIWGRSAEVLYSSPQKWTDFIVPEDSERVQAIFAGLTGNVPTVDMEYRIWRPGGEIRWVHVRGFQVRDAEDKLIRLTGIVTDITDRKHLEAQLFQSQKMETVGKLAGGVAHEFNNIMTAIIGQSELLLSDLSQDSSLRTSAIEIHKAADRASDLTRQLLAYGRKQILQPEILDLNSVLAGMKVALRHLMGRGTDVRIIPAAGLNTVMADVGQIEQVILNIATNAADAMPNGGKLTLETANVTLDRQYVSHSSELKAGEYVMLAITDTGAGMSEEVKARIFEPFFTTKGVGQGTGLGLSTSYGIVKQSGGHITVYSELSRGSSFKGTSFKIYLPQVEQQTKISTGRADSSDLPGGTETILLAEDDPALREMTTTLLRRLGYTVFAAVDGIEALNLKLQRDIGDIDLLFTDVVMPHMSGKELSELVRKLYPNTKILFTTAYTENAIVHQGVLNKGVHLLQKPFTPSALAHKFREVLDEPNVR